MNGQYLWINTTLEEQKEINNSRHLYFLFATRTLICLSFSINLLDDNNKQITLAESEKKISILNFKIDVFLR